MRRLAAAVISAHTTCDGHAYARTDDRDARDAFAERIEDLGAMVQLLPAVHGLRIAADHIREVHARWTSEPQDEALQMALAMALLRRVVEDTDPAFRAAA